jgi:hypothetical protein
VTIGLRRITDGEPETGHWLCVANIRPGYLTDRLLQHTRELRADVSEVRQ